MSLLDLFIKRSDKTVSLLQQPKKKRGIFSAIFGSSPENNMESDAALGLTSVWRAVHILAESIASLPIGVYRKLPNGDIELDEEHPVHKLISNKPSNIHTSYIWRETKMVHLCLDGNAYSKIVLNKKTGLTERFEMIDPKKVLEIIRMGNGVYGYKINGLDKVIPQDQILHIPGMGYNGIVGKSPIESHRETLLTDQASRDYAKNFYQNGTHISGYLKVDGELSDPAYERMSKSWESAYAGPKNVGKTAILESNTEFVPITMSPDDAGWLNTRRNVVEDVSRIYGVPMHMLQSLERATFNNIEHLSIEFIKHTLTPWVKRWEGELNCKLFPNDPTRFIRFDMSGLLRGDLETMGEYYTKLYNIGVLNRNEIRRFINLNSVEDGDRYFIQGNNMVPVDKIDELISSRGSSGQEEQDLDSITEDK